MEKLLIGVSGVILGAILTVAREFWNDHRTKKKKAQFLAIRVTTMLDRFVEGCVSVVSDDGEMYGRDEQGCLRVNSTTPVLNFDSLDVDWQSLPFDLMYEILNFPLGIEEANGMIGSVCEHVASPPDYEEGFEERHFQYSNIGLQAYELSKKIRERYGMPKNEFKYWNPIDFLEKNKKEIDEGRANREERAAKFYQSA